ncbi:hypothetical protein CERZMDRAFT_85934 [Cercospora zeae-maydis SCOH1-5]|uniref:Uncharacterized protein n=1 Tax=Cercospora zeae-maydis SCOH1-5 TaxID=717836 RepID=A0A6A6FB14_9PEZI|nr:hypothetical protein CERZMDRAFT_85934 [Cercospora zeae-maydis SCOH1-5]
MQTDPGTTCIAFINQKRWPVVICADEVAPPQFIALRKDPAHLPAIQLGRHRYVFVDCQSLEPVLPHEDYLKGLRPFAQREIEPNDSPEIIEEKQRRKAFRSELQEFNTDKYWANYIKNQSEARKIEKMQRAERRAGKQKRRTPEDNGDSSPCRRKSHSQWSSSTPKRQKVQATDEFSRQLREHHHTSKASLSRGRNDSVIDLDEITDEHYNERFVPVALPSPVHAPTSARRSDKHRLSEQVYQSIESPGRDNGKSISTALPPIEPGPQECQIIFPHGDPDRCMIKQDLISKCQYLSVRACDDENATQLDLSKDKRAVETSLAASDLAAVREYYTTGEIGPRLVNRPEQAPHISKLDQMPKKKFLHTEALGKAFVTAVKIEDEPLQELIFQKLRVLYPFDCLGVMVLARCVSNLSEPTTDAHQHIFDMIVMQTTDCFWAIVKQHPGMLQRIFESNDTLRTTVFQRLSDDSHAGQLVFEEKRFSKSEIGP